MKGKPVAGKLGRFFPLRISRTAFPGHGFSIIQLRPFAGCGKPTRVEKDGDESGHHPLLKLMQRFQVMLHCPFPYLISLLLAGNTGKAEVYTNHNS
jgi:hypothetical protein